MQRTKGVLCSCRMPVLEPCRPGRMQQGLIVVAQHKQQCLLRTQILRVPALLKGGVVKYQTSLQVWNEGGRGGGPACRPTAMLAYQGGEGARAGQGHSLIVLLLLACWAGAHVAVEVGGKHHQGNGQPHSLHCHNDGPDHTTLQEQPGKCSNDEQALRESQNIQQMEVQQQQAGREASIPTPFIRLHKSAASCSMSVSDNMHCQSDRCCLSL